MNIRLLIILVSFLIIVYALFWGFVHAPVPGRASSATVSSKHSLAPQHYRIEVAPPADPTAGVPQY